MKKFLLICTVLMTLVLASCSKPLEGKNEYGWYTNFNECLDQAKKENKKIIHIISQDENDTVSAGLKERIFYTPEFANAFGDDFLFCETDISLSLFKAAKPGKDADSETKKNAKKFKRILEDRMRVVTTFGIENTPTLYLVTKEGYVIKDFRYLPLATVEDFYVMLDEYRAEINERQNMIENVRTSKGIEKVFAIDELYESTPVTFRYMLTDLMREVEKIDSKNESGLVGKFVMGIATSDVMDAYMAREPEKILGIYEECAKHPMLNPEQKQQTYFAAAHVIGTNTPTPEQTLQMIEYLEKAIAAKPESEIADRCRMNLEQVKEFKGRQDAAEARKKAEAEAADK